MYAFFFSGPNLVLNRPGSIPGWVLKKIKIMIGHPRTFYPDDVIHNTIGHVGSIIYIVNEVLFIYHLLLTLHIYAKYEIYNMHIRYIQYILHIRYIIHI